MILLSFSIVQQALVNEEELLEIVKDSNSGETVYFHKKCAEQKGLDSPEKIEQYFGKTKSVEQITPNNLSEEKAINILRNVAWVNLVLGVLGAILIWYNFGTMEVPYFYIDATHTETNPVGIALGFVSLIEGIFGWALFYVVAFTADNVNAIKTHLQIK